MGTRLLVITNSEWNIRKFRKDLIQSIHLDSFEVGIACPDTENLKGVFDSQDISYFDTGYFSYARFNPINFLVSLRKIYKIQKLFKPELTLSYTIKPNLLNGLVCRFLGTKYIPVITGLGTSFTQSGKLSPALRLLYRIAFKKSSSVVFQNKDDKQLFLSKKLVFNNQAKLIYGSGVDSSYFQSKTELPLEPVFLFIGRLLNSKGVAEFYQASKGFSDNPSVRFRILGSYDPKHPDTISEDLFNKINSGHIEYLGYSDEVKPLIESSTFIVLPSYREGLPKSVLEGLSMSRPILISEVSGCKDFFEFDEKPGIMFEAKDSESLKNAINQMLSKSHEDCVEMGKSGRRLIEKHFDIKIINQQMIDLVKYTVGEA
jgi:glycosyltransferase involved in cell wall biosynthesis